MTAMHIIGPIDFRATAHRILAVEGWCADGMIPNGGRVPMYSFTRGPAHIIIAIDRDQIEYCEVENAGRRRWIRTLEQLEAAAAGRRIPTMVTAEDDHNTRYRFERSLRIAYRRDSEAGGRWIVCRADNGRRLGWLCPSVDRAGTWDAWVDQDAFRGTGPDDRGDILDDVTGYLYLAYTDGTARQRPVWVGGATRDDAAQEIFRHLVRDRAPAAGFYLPNGHYGVRRYRRTR